MMMRAQFSKIKMVARPISKFKNGCFFLLSCWFPFVPFSIQEPQPQAREEETTAPIGDYSYGVSVEGGI
jgi:hypothetical protein